jgi:hypothetical protein
VPSENEEEKNINLLSNIKNISMGNEKASYVKKDEKTRNLCSRICHAECDFNVYSSSHMSGYMRADFCYFVRNQ